VDVRSGGSSTPTQVEQAPEPSGLVLTLVGLAGVFTVRKLLAVCR
jgi:hypothetical protein